MAEHENKDAPAEETPAEETKSENAEDNAPAAPEKKEEQPTTFAVFSDRGRQYHVSKGDTINVDVSDDENAAEGGTLEFDKVLYLHDGEKIEVGTPYIKGAKVSGVLQSVERGPKVITVKYRRRKDSKQKIGHRDWHFVLKVTDIVRA
ncbi:MAG: 50S ribosomal protein L21 [Planctomycetes bacterium]|nr:50S ribosomal protein L21 [Planctomycetota bacterium]